MCQVVDLSLYRRIRELTQLESEIKHQLREEHFCYTIFRKSLVSWLNRRVGS